MPETSGSAALPDSAEKRMKLRYAGVCRLCGNNLAAGAEAIYEKLTKTVRCVGDGVEPRRDPEPELSQVAEPATAASDVGGVAGSSARREYERRKANDEKRLREKWGRFGSIAVALADEKQTTKAWDTGAVGEERLGARLDALESESCVVLHDRRIPGSRANIDHLVVTSAGVWVIDAKRYQGRPELKIEGGLLRPKVEKMMVGRRDCTKLVDGALKQVGLVRAVVGELPVSGYLCFVDADWPLLGSAAFTTREVTVLSPRRLMKLLRSEQGTLDVHSVAAQVAGHFTPA